MLSTPAYFQHHLFTVLEAPLDQRDIRELDAQQTRVLDKIPGCRQGCWCHWRRVRGSLVVMSLCHLDNCRRVSGVPRRFGPSVDASRCGRFIVLRSPSLNGVLQRGKWSLNEVDALWWVMRLAHFFSFFLSCSFITRCHLLFILDILRLR